MSMLTQGIRALWRKLAYSSVDPAGPGGAFSRAIQAAIQGAGLNEVVEESDALELLTRALVPGHIPQDLKYPGWHQVEAANKVAGFGFGIRLLHTTLIEKGWEAGDPIEVDLLIGTMMPIPGAHDRRPLIEEIHIDGEDDASSQFARVEYCYEGDEAGHSLHFYRDECGVWLLDLVWELAQAGAMQEALGNVQGTGCPTERIEV